MQIEDIQPMLNTVRREYIMHGFDVAKNWRVVEHPFDKGKFYILDNNVNIPLGFKPQSVEELYASLATLELGLFRLREARNSDGK